MLKRHGIWGSGLLVSAMLDWCKRIARRYWQFASGIVGRSRMVGRENRFEVARPVNASKTLEVDCAGGFVKFKEFTEVMRIGDRIRAFCDDGVIEAEKISPTRFKLIYAVETTRSIH
jgi:hypothetical protein